MQVHYTRLFTDRSGASRFEDLTIELQQGFSAPGLETSIFSAPFLAGEGSLWVGAPSTWSDERLHQAPRRMIQVTTQGEYQITTSDGVIRRFPVGAVLLVEDTWGIGHSSKITSSDDLIFLAIVLPANAPT
jgi:hypothetical protein